MAQISLVILLWPVSSTKCSTLPYNTKLHWDKVNSRDDSAWKSPMISRVWNTQTTFVWRSGPVSYYCHIIVWLNNCMNVQVLLLKWMYNATCIRDLLQNSSHCSSYAFRCLFCSSVSQHREVTSGGAVRVQDPARARNIDIFLSKHQWQGMRLHWCWDGPISPYLISPHISGAD